LISGTSFKPIQRIEHGWRSRRWIYWNGSNDRITEFNWNQDQDARKKTIVGYIAYFKLTNGFEKSLFMTIKEMKDHGRKWSKNFNDKDCGWQRLRRNGKENRFNYCWISTHQIHEMKSDSIWSSDNRWHWRKQFELCGQSNTKEPKMTLELSNRLIVQKDVGFYRKCKIDQTIGRIEAWQTMKQNAYDQKIKILSKKTSK
jgi:hypothetical protein